MTPVSLEVQGLTISYRRTGAWAEAVSDVSLAIHAGEAYGLVGESGSGKSTLALALMRYLPRNGRIDAGAIRLDGHDLVRMDERDLRRVRGTGLAMVYQDPASALNPALSIGDQIAEVYRFHRGATREAALRSAREALTRVRMPDPEAVLRRYPHQLSGGQQQRVVIAMALAGDPRLLILDEPTTGLDVTIEAEVLDLIAALRREINAAILLISHNLGLVARICDRIGVMYAGRIVEEGGAREVLSSPRHPYTMGLLRCLPRFGATKRDVLLEPIPGALPFLGDRIPGCAFHPRCVLSRDRCRREAPELTDVAPGRRSRCHFWDEVETMPHAAGAGPRNAAPPSRERLLTITRLRKTYRGRGQPAVAVHEVSLEVMKGETFGLVGESGSGKTTLARCLVGLTEPDGGELTVAGRATPWRGRARGLATLRAMQMVFQNPDTTLNPSWTVRGILGRAVRVLLGLSGRPQARRVAELASQVRLEPRHLDLRAAQLSGGQPQRAAIARALAGNPQLAVCDEPTSALDVSVQAAILGLLLEVQAARGVSYILISHDLAVVRYLADRIGVMYLAQLVEVGEADAVFGGPRHPYTEALLSAVPALGREAPPRLRLGGPIPSLTRPPTGCRFHTRCPRKLGAICEQEAPPGRMPAGDTSSGVTFLWTTFGSCRPATDPPGSLRIPDRAVEAPKLAPPRGLPFGGTDPRGSPRRGQVHGLELPVGHLHEIEGDRGPGLEGGGIDPAVAPMEEHVPRRVRAGGEPVPARRLISLDAAGQPARDGADDRVGATRRSLAMPGPRPCFAPPCVAPPRTLRPREAGVRGRTAEVDAQLGGDRRHHGLEALKPREDLLLARLRPRRSHPAPPRASPIA